MATASLLGCVPTIGSTGDFKVSEDVEVILQSLYVILSTPKGTRIWQPTFGCDMSLRLFDLMDSDTYSLIKQDVTTAIQTWEPRITLKNVEVENVTENNLLVLTISFKYGSREYTKIFNTNGTLVESIYNIFS